MDRPKTSAEKFANALSARGAVFKALMIREFQSRFGRDNIGILWVIGEPLLLATAISLIHILRGGDNAHGSIQPGMFTLLGYTCFIVFRGLFNRAAGILDSSLPLLYHRMINLLDLMMVKVVVETVGCFGAYLVLMTIFVTLGMGDLPYRPLYLLAAYGLMAWLSLAASMIVATLTHGRATLERLTHTFSYFMMPVSGAFFMVEWLPVEYQRIIVWNPLTDIFEILRYGQFESASPDFIYFGYVVGVNSVLTYMGLIMLRQVRLRLHFT